MRHPFLVFVPILLFYLSACTSQEGSSSQQEEKSTPSIQAPSSERSTILFFGNSLTYGFGLEDQRYAFPNLIQKRIDSLGFSYDVVNAGLSGETTTSGKNRLQWVLRQPVDILVLSLGGNDGLRGIDPEITRKNLQAMIDLARSKYPDISIILAGMKAPPNMGETFTNKFEILYQELAMINQTALIPFLLEDVAGEPELNLPDGIHPNRQGHKIVAENAWEVLKGLL